MLSTIASFSLLAASVLAIPTERGSQQKHCLTKDEAQVVATNYGNLIATYSDALANVALAPNFTDYSESVNTLINECPQGSAAITLPLLAPTFTNRTAFEIGQGQQPQINFKQLNIWHSCNSVTIRWETTNTAPIPNPKPVVGLIVMETIPAPAGNMYPNIIDTVYSEFDAGAWLANLKDAGICAGAPAGGASTTVGTPVATDPPTFTTRAFPTTVTDDCTTTTFTTTTATLGAYIATGIQMA